MEYFNGILQQDFNTVYTTLENNVITYPPYLEGRVPETFYFNKRGGFEEYSDPGYDEIYKIMYDGYDKYYLGKIGSNIVVKKNTTTIYTGAFSVTKTYKFIYGPGGKGTVTESGALATGGSTAGEGWLEDTAKSWTTDQFIGQYVYVYDADKGYGEFKLIQSNDATKLYFGTAGFQELPTNASYKIFDDFGEVLYFVGADGLYGIHNETNVIQAKSFGNVRDIVYANDMFFYITTNNDLYKSVTGSYLILFSDDTSYIGNKVLVQSMTTFGDYVLLLGKLNIDLIKKETLKISDTQTEDFYTTSNVTKEFGLLTPSSFDTYNNGLFVITNNRKFLSVTITPVSETKFTTETKDEGIYIQKYLDNIIDGSSVTISIDPNEIQIINSDAGYSHVYKFDRYYRGWHRWTTGIEFTEYYQTLDIYFGGKGYKVNQLLTEDEGALQIVQKIRLVFGSENITSFKRVIWQKLILGTKTSPDFYINYSIISGSDAINFIKNIANVNILNQNVILEGLNDTTLGQTLTGLGLLGGGADEELVQNLYPSVGTVKIPFGVSLELLSIDLIAEGTKKIVYGGMLIGHEVVLPHITDVKNTI